MGKPDDLLLTDWPRDLDWSPSNAAASLETARAVVRDRGVQAMDWYMGQRTSMSWRSTAVRGLVSLFVAVGAICPALTLTEEIQAMVQNETQQWSGEIAAALVELQAAADAAGQGQQPPGA